MTFLQSNLQTPFLWIDTRLLANRWLMRFDFCFEFQNNLPVVCLFPLEYILSHWQVVTNQMQQLEVWFFFVFIILVGTWQSWAGVLFLERTLSSHKKFVLLYLFFSSFTNFLMSCLISFSCLYERTREKEFVTGFLMILCRPLQDNLGMEKLYFYCI